MTGLDDEQIRCLVDAAPPLTDEVRSRIAAILRSANAQPAPVVRREVKAA
ncbi:hypothetical protein ACPB67_02460 [Micromonospora taraxaci]